jgi:hypothetical protein
VKRQLEALEEWDPDAFNGSAIERQRLHLLAQSSELQTAHEAAVRAVALARGADETYQATRLLARIECESGRHQAELRHARRLMKLGPQNEHSLLALRHAEACNGLGTSPGRQAQPRPQIP